VPEPATSWGAGDYPLMAQRLRGAAKRVVERARVAPGERVLDVACGTGNAALLAAARGAGEVVGVDLEPSLLAVAQLRAEEIGAPVAWVEGDAESLPVDGGFDAVLSVFGVMYASDQEAAARELARVCAPDRGRVVLASWLPGSFMPALGAVVAPFLPPSTPGSESPVRWGDEATVRTLLDGAGLRVVSAEQESLVLTAPDRMHAVGFLIKTAGNVLAQRPRIERAGRWGELLAAVSGLVAERDSGAEENVALRCEYLLVEASPR
jgi:ubiquinone/menaquinone biosynthesis C-methylase UbiE